MAFCLRMCCVCTERMRALVGVWCRWLPLIRSNACRFSNTHLFPTYPHTLAQIADQEAIELVNTIPDTDIDLKVGAAIKGLWKDPALQKTWARRSEFQIVESVKYYFNKIDEISQPDYLASDDDILYARVRTSGIVTERYMIDGTMFEMYDVGGQRNERKKWIHCFDNVTAIIFVAALSEYDQVLFEDASTNRMIEAIQLFKEICNNKFFAKSSMLLFLNKKDLFAEKIWVKDIKDVPQFSDYKGGLGDFDSGVEYFVNLFLAVNDRPNEKIVYNHVTCATDTKNVEVVMNACKDIITRGSLKDSGFM